MGRGTAFHVWVPASEGRQPEQVAEQAEFERSKGYGLFGTKVLLVENDRAVLEGMAALLGRWQCEVRAATSAQRALAALGDTDWVPDIIIADQHLDHGDLGSVTIAKRVACSAAPCRLSSLPPTRPNWFSSAPPAPPASS